MADIIPHNALALLAKKAIDMDNDSLKVALIDDTYTPNADDDTFETGSDPFDSEIANGNGYTTGGVVVAGSSTDSDANDNAVIDIANPEWTAADGDIGPFRYAVLWDDTATNDPIIYIFDLGAAVTISDGDTWSINIDANGLFTMAQA